MNDMTIEAIRPTTPRVKPLARPPRVDWFRVIVNLERRGFTTRDLATMLAMSHGWIHHIKNSPGAEPRHDIGCLLLDFWCDEMDKPLSDVPRERPSICRR
jgi:hypothetical protein